MAINDLKFRPLTANEVEVRLNKVYGDKGLYLLYKDARVDMNILDEVFTPWGWQREHREMKGVIYCGLSIKSPDGEWITKWDAGSESNTEKEKGEASDSFKRACFNWGIGRELYTAPTIKIPLTKDEIDKQKGNIYGKVTNMQVENGKITALEIVDGKGNVRFTMGKQQLPNKPVELKQTAPSAKKVPTIDTATITIEDFRAKWYGKEYSITNNDCADVAKAWGLCSNPKTMPVQKVVDMVLNHAKIKGEQGIEENRQELIVSVESAESEKELKTLYDANVEIIDEYIRDKFTARKNKINNSKKS